MKGTIAIVGGGMIGNVAAREILCRKHPEIILVESEKDIPKKTFPISNPYQEFTPFIPPPPQTKVERKWGACKFEALNHINGKRTLRDEYNLILEKKSELSKSCRDWVVSLFTEN